MTSEIRVNKINNRAGLGTITIADTGVVVNGIVTCTEVSGLNVLNIAGVSTFASTLDINGDIDVDGHTNLDNLSVAGVSSFSDDVTFTGTTGNIVFDKSDNSLNIKDGTGLKIGDGADLHIYHGGAGLANATFIDENGSGRLRIRTNDYVEIGKIASAEMSARFFADGACELYHDNVKRLETSAKGIQVGTGVTIETNGQATFTGIVTASAFKLSDGSNVGGVESDAQENTVGGTNAGDSFSGTSATHNTLFGYDCGTSIDTGDRNSAYGADALKLLTSGTNNSVFGAEAMDSATTAEKNVAMGYRAAYSATSCANGVFIGHECAEVLTTGSHNIIIGGGCGHDLTTGGYNTLVGYKAGSEGSSNKLTTGSNNLLLGHD